MPNLTNSNQNYFINPAMDSSLLKIFSNNITFLFTNNKYEIRFASNALLKLLGIEKKKLYGNSFLSFFTLKTTTENALLNKKKLTNSEQFHAKIDTPDGSITFKVNLTGIENGNLLILNKILQEESDPLLKMAFKFAQIGIWESDWNSMKFKWSQEAEAIYGMEPGEFDGKIETFHKKVYPEDLPTLVEKLQQSIYSGSKFKVNHRIIKKDGSIAWVKVIGDAIRDEEGNIVRVAGTIMDITKWKHAETALSETESKFKVATEHINHLLYEYYIPTGIITWEGTIEKLTGYSHEEFSTFHITEWENNIHPDDREKTLSTLKKAIETGNTFSVKYRFRHKNGTYFIVEDNGIISIEKGIPIKMIGIMKDITEQLQIEAKLEKNEEHFRSLLTNLQIGVIVQNTESEILFANQKAADIFAIPINFLIGSKTVRKSTWSILNEKGEIFPPGEKPFIRALKQKKTIENILVGIKKTKNAPIQWLLLDAHPELDASGNVKEVISTFFDITQQRKSEASLKNIAIGVSASTGKGFFNTLVSFLAKTLEVDLAYIGSVTDKTNITFLSACLNGKLIPNIHYATKGFPCEKALQSSTPYFCEKTDSFGLYFDKSLKQYLGTPLKDTDGNAIGILAVLSNKISNVTTASSILQVFASRASAEIQRLDAEQEKTLLIDKLLKQNKELQEFSYLLSHTVRAPVATMLGLTSLFDSVHTESTFNAELIDKMKKVSSDLDNVIKDLSNSLNLRDISDIQENVDIAALIQKITKDLSTLGNTEANIKTNFSKAPLIYTVKTVLYNILYALIENAIKFSNPHTQTEITVSSEIHDRTQIIKVKDNGLGIDLKKYQGQLFNIYKRFHLHIQGKGLGLYHVKLQVNSLEGKIDIQSKVNEGTEITISLPLLIK